MTSLAFWSSMEGAPKDRPVLLVNEKGEQAVATWYAMPIRGLPAGVDKSGYWRLTGCAFGFDDPIAWADCPKGPND